MRLMEWKSCTVSFIRHVDEFIHFFLLSAIPPINPSWIGRLSARSYMLSTILNSAKPLRNTCFRLCDNMIYYVICLRLTLLKQDINLF